MVSFIQDFIKGTGSVIKSSQHSCWVHSVSTHIGYNWSSPRGFGW